MIEFDKYKKRGAYHWQGFNNPKSTYRKHVAKVLWWARKGRTLDIGAGDGLITHFLKADGVDNNPTAVRLAQNKGARVEYGSAYDLSKYRGYDNVLMLDVIEHLEEPEKALQEVRKVLNGNGRLYITTPIKKDPINKYHYQEWTPCEFMTFMQEQGWVSEDFTVERPLKTMYGIFKPIEHGVL